MGREMNVRRDYVAGTNTLTIKGSGITCVELRNCMLAIESNTLRTISVTFTAPHLSRPSPTHFAEKFILPHHTTLTTLTIVSALGDPGNTTSARHIAYLPRLQQLVLRCTPAQAESLLACITYPSTTAIILQLSGASDTELVSTTARIAAGLGM